MDYLKIVLEGFINSVTRKHLSNYYLREFKKAEKDHYSVEEFFDGCLSILEAFYGYIDKQINDRKRELNQLILLAKDDKEEIEKFVSEAISLNRDNYYANLHYLTKNKYNGHLANEQIKYIEYHLNFAKAELEGLSKPKEILLNNNIEAGEILNKKDHYFKEVIKRAEGLLNCLMLRYLESSNKVRLIETEIDKYKKLLFAEELPLLVRSNMDFPIGDYFYDIDYIGHLNAIQIGRMVHHASSISIEDGKPIKKETKPFKEPKPKCKGFRLNSIEIGTIRDYYHTQIVEGIRDFESSETKIKVEAYNRYYKWLISFNETYSKQEVDFYQTDKMECMKGILKK